MFRLSIKKDNKFVISYIYSKVYKSKSNSKKLQILNLN